MKRSIIEKILNDVALDPRITDGIFSLEENSHMDVLREYLINKGIEKEIVREYTNLVLDGKYPERQAFNQNGILVTFPSPEYKARAIKRGTHFEKDPTKGKPNIFGGGEQGSQQAPQSPASAPAVKKGGENAPQPKTNLPLSQAGDAGAPQPETPQPESPAPATVAAPQQVQTPQEPVVNPEEPAPPPPPATPEEKEANKSAIKKMLKGDDYMLEENGIKSSDSLEIRNGKLYVNGRLFVVTFPSDQPMKNIEDGSIITVFRGHLYNHWEPEDIEGYFV